MVILCPKSFTVNVFRILHYDPVDDLEALQNKKYVERGLDTSKLDFLLHRINRLESTISSVDLSKTEKSGRKGGGKDGEGAITDPIGLQPVGQGVV